MRRGCHLFTARRCPKPPVDGSLRSVTSALRHQELLLLVNNFTSETCMCSRVRWKTPVTGTRTCAAVLRHQRSQPIGSVALLLVEATSSFPAGLVATRWAVAGSRVVWQGSRAIQSAERVQCPYQVESGLTGPTLRGGCSHCHRVEPDGRWSRGHLGERRRHLG